MRTAALALSLLLITAACSGEPDAAPDSSSSTTSTTEFVPGTLADRMFSDYTSQELGLSLKFPIDWLPDEDLESGFVGFTSPPIPGDTYIENFHIVVVDLGDGVGLDQFVQQDAATVANATEDYEVTGGYSDRLAGEDAVVVALSTSLDGIDIAILRVVAVVGQRGIVFTFLASAEDFDNFGPVVQQILDSVSLTAP